MFLTGRLAGATALAGLSPVLVPSAPFAALSLALGIVALLVAVDVVSATPPRDVVHARVLSPVVRVGQRLEVRLELRVPTRSRVGVRDAVPPSLGSAPEGALMDAPPGTGSVTYTIAPTRRGRFAFGPVTVRTYGRLGLAGRQRRVPLPGSLKVYPELRGRRQVEHRIAIGRMLEAGSRTARVRGRGGEFDMLREYHPDDEFRAINWVATARAERPITNVYRDERSQQVLLLLDAGRVMAGTVGGAPRFEHALDAGVALASVALGAGDRVGAFAFADRIRASVAPAAGAAHAGRIVDALFAIEPDVVASDYRGAMGTALGRHRRRAMLVLFSDLADEGALDPLVGAIPALVRRHVVVVAQVADPEVDRLARLEPTSAADAFRKAAATAAAGRRERAAGRLVRMGATVLDQPPGRLAPALADVYLRVKAAGRL